MTRVHFHLREMPRPSKFYILYIIRCMTCTIPGCIRCTTHAHGTHPVFAKVDTSDLLVYLDDETFLHKIGQSHCDFPPGTLCLLAEIFQRSCKGGFTILAESVDYCQDYGLIHIQVKRQHPIRYVCVSLEFHDQILLNLSIAPRTASLM